MADRIGATPTLGSPHTQPDAGTLRQTRHALAAMSHMDSGRRRDLRTAIGDYLTTLSRLLETDIPPVAHADALTIHDRWTRMLGLSFPRRTSPAVTGVARSVLDALDAEVDQLEAAARATGQPHAIVMLHVIGGTR
ncbi:hypothetical protein [Streptomyces sp. WMMC897]|uniref:hypothetical protein n=1 Tax=Streptomyces sp. WMMC897 TaxID=3014782 RepID=UPI0022B65CE2|nr:hypothetical protein [Streptomyces sp. WMMC897]MCZ7413052.1 hypothetical protein [Streptomyces sp. WMMC897]MCZ7413140.1 hypothetical protein [Streptomyces sp. WMMC897]MCZ7415476.1 hypothetical protein [Streptomyces sp. WMMC897]